MAPIAEIERTPKIREIDYPTSDGKPMAETDLHAELMIYCRMALKEHYANEPMIYVSGNNFLYYEKDNLKKFVSPDCYVVYGVANHLRDTYKLWQENGILPSVVFEFTSKSTRHEDTKKLSLYEQTLSVDEYFRYDPTGDYLNPRLQGFQLEHGQYAAMPLESGDRLYSRNLGLCLVMQGENFRFYDPRTDQYLKTYSEQFERAQREAERARNAEDELTRLRAEFEKMKQQNAAE